jgi:hypothetical protein
MAEILANSSSRVPGLALSQPPYVWLTENELLRFSSDEGQQEFTGPPVFRLQYSFPVETA